MKRSAAILGPTPPFVRWAIRFDCPLRELSEENLPDVTFRQLRGLRELSHGIRERRVFEGICLHPELNDSGDTAKGFFAEEICEVFGGSEYVETCCHTCQANACHQNASTIQPAAAPIWAGCYGWLPARFEDVDYTQEFQAVLDDKDLQITIDDCKQTTSWYGLWQIRHWQGPHLKRLHQILNALLKRSTKPVTLDQNLLELAAAVKQCLIYELPFETDLIPAGHSDGTHWRIEPHCPNCLKEMAADQTVCLACGRQGNPNPSVKRKVLGQRPYSLLHRLIGRQQTDKLLALQPSRKRSAASD